MKKKKKNHFQIYKLPFIFYVEVLFDMKMKYFHWKLEKWEINEDNCYLFMLKSTFVPKKGDIKKLISFW